MFACNEGVLFTRALWKSTEHHQSKVVRKKRKLFRLMGRRKSKIQLSSGINETLANSHFNYLLCNQRWFTKAAFNPTIALIFDVTSRLKKLAFPLEFQFTPKPNGNLPLHPVSVAGPNELINVAQRRSIKRHNKVEKS